jgi:hypothetical protein
MPDMSALPGFWQCQGDPAGLNITCAKAATPQATLKSTLTAIAVAGIIGAAIASGLRK